MSGSDLSTHQAMRISTISRVIKALQTGATSKSEILENTQLSWGSCSTIINMLYEESILVKEKEEGRSGRGRKTFTYSFNSKEHLLFGMEIRANEILCSIINFGKQEIYRQIYPTMEAVKASNLYGYVSKAFINTLLESSVKPEHILGISFAVAGGVDVINLKWVYTPRISGIHNLDFRRLIRILPEINYLHVEHDIHAQAASVINSRNWDDDNYVFLHIGRGISMSIYNNGLFLGSRGFSGEIGHIPVPTCEADEEKNVESAISVKGILDFINKHFSLKLTNLSDLTPEIINNEEVIIHIAKALEYVLIVATNIIDPKTIIVGGPSIEPFYDTLRNRIEETIRYKTWIGGPENIKWYHNDDMFGAYGTILNASEKMINSYIEDHLI